MPLAYPQSVTGFTEAQIIDSTGTVLNKMDGSGSVSASFQWGAASVDIPFFVAGRAYRVKSITARVRVAGSDGGAVTAEIRKAGSTVAPASGTILHSGSINLKGTADTNQSITLVTTASTLALAAGDALVIDFTGTLTAAVGVVTVLLEPI
jgi:hypothetical protein